MKRNRRLDSIIKQVLAGSIKNGKIDEAKVGEFSKSFAKLNRPDAIYALSQYLKLIKIEEDKTTMKVQSTTPLSKTDLDQIKKHFNSQFSIVNSQFELLPSILGGILVKIGDMVFDYSVKGKIEQVREVIRS